MINKDTFVIGKTSLTFNGGIYYKCEFQNPTGSVKDRGISFQVERLSGKNIKNAVISSSGNAAISASYYCNLCEIQLTAFVSPNINPKKLAAIYKNTKIIKSRKAVSSAFKLSKELNIPNLRQSTDPFGSAGYMTLAYELSQQNKKIDAVFLPVSSGATLKGIYEGFKKLNFFPSFHAVQTTKIHTLAQIFDKEFKYEDKSLADAIVARYLSLENELVSIIKKTKGFAWVISNSQMQNAKKILESLKLNASYEGAAALAALHKAKEHGFEYKNPVVLLTGKDYGLDK